MSENESEEVQPKSESNVEPSEVPNSLADRRKIYENRSLTMGDEKRKSPPNVVGRQESFTDRTDSKSNSHQTNGSSVKSKRTSTVFGKVSKFRHLKGTNGHKSTHIENIKNVSRQISGECDGFHGKMQKILCKL